MDMELKYDFKLIEPGILKYWKDHKIYGKAKEKASKGKDFYFLDGPPYTSGRVHIGTAWNKSIKDAFLRYKRMQGLNVWDRAGYDMHGLPIEHQVEAKFKLKNKDEVIKFGLAKYIEECRKFSVEQMGYMNNDFTKLGVWMDFDNAYQPIKEENIEGHWWLIRKAHDQGRLYQGSRTVPWCSHCETAVAKHELEYKNVKENSIFIKFALKNNNNEYLVVWTTTPWTIPFNLAIMVNPDLDYVRAKVGNEIYIIAKALVNVFCSAVLGKKFEIVEEFKGDKLEGLEYTHIFAKEIDYAKIKQKAKKTHTVLMSTEYVDTSAGTGLVHCAPGSGPEDYEIGHRNGIPAFNTLSEAGVFGEGSGKFTGLTAKKDDKKFIKFIQETGSLLAESEVEHDYPHCWRCKKPVVFRATPQWFFKVEDLKDEMVKLNQKIKWVPEAGFNAFDSWLKNLRDNSITKQRFWGTPLPIWRCVCGKYDVLSTRKEIEQKSGKKLKDLHRPYIDEAEIPCECGKKKKRITDVLDVWIDPGCASWTCLYYPQKDDLFKRLFPADFILEGKDQYRGWFNVLMVCSMLAFKKPSFKACYVHGFVQDSQGRKMSKSLGNYILPEEVIEKYGADTFRYYTIGGTNPGVDLNYNFEDMGNKHRGLAVLWNVHKYLLDMANNLEINPAKLKIGQKNLGIEERYMLSRLNSTIRKATGLYEGFLLNEIPWQLERLYLDLSRVYIQMIRDKASVGSEDEKKDVVHTVYTSLIAILKMFSTVCPFISEQMYLNIKEAFRLKEESITLFSWPEFDEKLINEELENDMAIAQNVISAALYAREKIQMGVRWPLKEIIIVSKDKNAIRSVERLDDVIKSQANVKGIAIKYALEGVGMDVKPDASQIRPDFREIAEKVIEKLGSESPEKILKEIEKHGKYEMEVSKRKVNIVKEHLIITRKVPETYVEMEFSNGLVYLNRYMSPELEAEGYAREITRRVQALRKNSCLEKKDSVNLWIKADNELSSVLKAFEAQIKEKVGAKTIKIVPMQPSTKHEFTSKDKIKGKEIVLFMDRA